MSPKIDEIDKRIIYRLSEDARNTTSSEIADELGVSPGTIRNRIQQMEEEGIINGYLTDVDYERIGKRIVYIFQCSSTAKDRSVLAKKALRVPGVINVRELMTGNKDLVIKAVGGDTDDISRIGIALENLGIEIQDEDLLKKERFHPYHPFGPSESEKEPLVNLRGIVGNAEVADLTVKKSTPVENKTIEEINNLNLLSEDVIIVAIERGDKIITPRGSTQIKPGDIVTLFSPNEISNEILDVFTGKRKDSPRR